MKKSTTPSNENFIATIWSKALAQALCTDQAFVVHSVFRSGMNLALWERLVYIGSDCEGMRPFGILLPETALASLLAACRQGDRGIYLLRNQRLLFESGIVVDMSEAALWDGSIAGVQRGEIQAEKALILLDNCWAKHKPEYGLSQEFPRKEQLLLAFKGAIGGNHEANAAANEEAEGKANGAASAADLDFWMGRGLGLTPSGDDMLMGFMALSHWAGRPEYCGTIRLYLANFGKSRTTAVSYEYLHYASQGIFSQEVLELLERMADADLCEQAFCRLLAVGHSSGADTILGIMGGLELLTDRVSSICY
jgi:hypothetical protein